MNAIRWINEYSIVPGLANLHFRFGFNQSSFAYIAALNFHPYFNAYAFHIANSFLYLILGLQLLNANVVYFYIIYPRSTILDTYN